MQAERNSIGARLTAYATGGARPKSGSQATLGGELSEWKKIALAQLIKATVGTSGTGGCRAIRSGAGGAVALGCTGDASGAARISQQQLRLQLSSSQSPEESVAHCSAVTPSDAW
jgi:hypothetical protein